MSNFAVSPSITRYSQPLAELRPSYLNRRLVVGVAIVAAAPHSDDGQRLERKSLLLLQRSAHEEDYPLMYEVTIPGGHVEEDKDATILHAVARETLEETGLVVKHIVKDFEGFEYETRKGITVQLNFLVEVETSEETLQVTLNPEEHDAFAWIEQGEDLERFSMTSSMRTVVENALRLINKL